jgi:hypothetical protein
LSSFDQQVEFHFKKEDKDQIKAIKNLKNLIKEQGIKQVEIYNLNDDKA